MESFMNVISQMLSLSEQSRLALGGKLQRLEHPKGYVLVSSHSICKRLYFIEKGLTRTYYIKGDKEITDWISLENDFACSVVSFLTRRPDGRMIQLLEPSILWSVTYDDLMELSQQHKELELFWRRLSETCILQMQKRFDSLQFASALERYSTLLQENPSVVQRVPLKMVATYLGMTQETLSRIRTQF